jgi:hypothetical protein
MLRADSADSHGALRGHLPSPSALSPRTVPPGFDAMQQMQLQHMQQQHQSQQSHSQQRHAMAPHERVLAERAARGGHKHSSSTDSDADSLASFGCLMSDEFDRQARDRDAGKDGPMLDATSRQQWLDGMFTKLALRHARKMGAGDERHEKPMQTTQAQKPKAHFLDLSGYINPIPLASANHTPRPTDAQRFASSAQQAAASSSLMAPSTREVPRRARTPDIGHHPSSSAGSNQLPGGAPSGAAHTAQLLRSRRSADSLGDTRRRQKLEWAQAGAAGPNSSNSAAKPSAPPSAYGGTAMQVTQSHDPSAMSSSGVPQLPGWARESNRNLSISSVSSGYSTASSVSASSHHSSGSTTSSRPQTPGYAHGGNANGERFVLPRPALMARTVSHDVGGDRPTRPVLMARGSSSQLRTLPAPGSLTPGCIVPRGILTPLPPPSSSQQHQQQAHLQQMREGALSPVRSRPPPLLRSRASRGSMSSDGNSSVPSTPAHSVVELPIPEVMGQQPMMTMGPRCLAASSPIKPPPSRGGLAMQGQPLLEMTSDEEEDLLAGSGRYTLHRHAVETAQAPVRAQQHQHQQQQATQHSTPRASATARPSARHLAMPHVADIFDLTRAPPSPPRNASLRKMHGAPGGASGARPRAASTASSMHSHKTSVSSTTSSCGEAAEETSRISYLSRTSSTSSGSTDSTPASPDSPRSVATRLRTTSRAAEDWASSIGRRFARHHGVPEARAKTAGIDTFGAPLEHA